MGQFYEPRGLWWRGIESILENLMLPDWIINQMYIEELGSYVHPTFYMNRFGT